MAADFWAGYLSGAVGIVVGNPLDLIKVRLQAQASGFASGLGPEHTSGSVSGPGHGHALRSRAAKGHFRHSRALVTGTAAPVLGYGALNALLFVSYNRSEEALNRAMSTHRSLWATWLAGATGGLATWVVSTPTELVKCRAQVSTTSESSWAIARQIWRNNGVRGLYLGGLVTALRDSIGYGFYFWSYELATSLSIWQRAEPEPRNDRGVSDVTVSVMGSDAPKILLCGGLAGVATWASVFPFDVVKTRLQTQTWNLQAGHKPSGALQIAKDAYRKGGLRVFFRGLAVCSARAFFVNAIQWAVYEAMMHEMGQSRSQRAARRAESEGSLDANSHADLD